MNNGHKLIAYSIFALDTGLSFIGYMYGIDHGHNIIAYWFLFGAILFTLFGREYFNEVVKNTEKT